MGLLLSQSDFQFCMSLHTVFSVETSLFRVAVDGLATGTPFLMTRVCTGSRGCSSRPLPGLSSLWNWGPSGPAGQALLPVLGAGGPPCLSHQIQQFECIVDCF